MRYKEEIEIAQAKLNRSASRLSDVLSALVLLDEQLDQAAADGAAIKVQKENLRMARLSVKEMEHDAARRRQFGNLSSKFKK